MLKKVQNIDETAKDGGTALLYALEYKQSNEVVNYLIKAGAGVTQNNHDGMTPLHYAAFGRERGSVLKNLLARGANLTAQNNNGDTPLHFAAARNTGMAASRLIALYAQNNISMDLPNSDLRTPLHHACHFNSNVKIIQQLLAQGADLNYWDNEGRTPLDYLKLNDTELYEKIAAAHIKTVPLNKIISLGTAYQSFIDMKDEEIN